MLVQVTIDGFDPEKFRVANQHKAAQKISASQQMNTSDDSDIFISHKIPSIANRFDKSFYYDLKKYIFLLQ